VEFDGDTWTRTVYEALRPIDPQALFNVGLTELDFRGTPGHTPAAFPAADFAAFVDGWLDGLDPDASAASRTGWEGGGVRLVLRALGRSSESRGWKDMPSFNQLQPEIGDLHLTSGERIRFTDLDREQIRRLASGDLSVVGQGAGYRTRSRG
jgi:hypothetical protein